MKKKQYKESRQPGSRGYLILGVMFTILAVGVWFLLNRDNIHEYRETYRSREEAKLKISQTKQKIALLKHQQQSLADNGLESMKQIRQRYQMHKPGEQVMFFSKEATTQSQITSAPIAETPAGKGIQTNSNSR